MQVRTPTLSILLWLALTSGAAADAYRVSYNPYESVNWETDLRLQSQHHDHIFTSEKVTLYDRAGYNAVTFLTYSGLYRPSTLAAWLALGSPAIDPGQAVHFVEYRRWPPENHGAPDLSELSNLFFYIPGAEEVGLLPEGRNSFHILSTFTNTYLEGAGCDACGPAGVPVAQHPELPDDQRYSDDQELIDLINLHGGHPTINHPTSPVNFLLLDDFKSIEIFNNYIMLLDEFDGGTRSDNMLDLWDQLLEESSPKIWGTAANDWYGPTRPPGPPPVSNIPFLTEQNLDRGKLQVLVSVPDLATYQEAYEAGAFFAVVEDHAVKNAYPHITRITRQGTLLRIETASQSESLSWIGNGAEVGTGSSLNLADLAPNLRYVRSEVRDGVGRTVYVQPFSLNRCGDTNHDWTLDEIDVRNLRLSLISVSPPGPVHDACRTRLGTTACDVVDLARLHRTAAGTPPADFACD